MAPRMVAKTLPIELVGERVREVAVLGLPGARSWIRTNVSCPGRAAHRAPHSLHSRVRPQGPPNFKIAVFLPEPSDASCEHFSGLFGYIVGCAWVVIIPDVMEFNLATNAG